MVLDLESGAVVFVGDGKGADALKPFWKRLRPSRAKIEAVAMDMSAAYREAVSTHLPEAKIVFDRFHVIKLFNEKLSDLRRASSRSASIDRGLGPTRLRCRRKAASPGRRSHHEHVPKETAARPPDQPTISSRRGSDTIR